MTESLPSTDTGSRSASVWSRSTAMLLGSSLFSVMGASALVTALGKYVFDLTGRELDLGLLGLAEFAPAALLVLVTGAIADRRDRRRIAAAGLVGEAAISLVLLAYVASSPTAVGPIFAIGVAFGTARAFAAPAFRALPPDVVGPEGLPWLVARWSGTFQIGLIAGPVLAGFLLTIDDRAPYAAACGLFLISAVLVLAVQLPESAATAPDHDGPPRPGLHDALEGLRFLRSQPILLGAISLDLFAVLFGGAIALLPAIADERLGVGDLGFGWLRASVGIGAGAVTLWLARRPLTRSVGRVLLTAVALFGLGTVVLGLTHNYAVAFVALFVLSGADAVSVFIRSTLVPLVTPRDTRGRVLAVEMVFIGASNELGAFESGVTGQWLGPGLAVVVGGIATLVVAASWWVLFPSLRDIDRFPAPAA